MTIADKFNKLGYADIIFDPIPSYSGVWFFDVTNLSHLSKVVDGINLFDQFVLETYKKPLEKILNSTIQSSFPVGMLSEPNADNIGRTLKYSKYDFFAALIDFLDQKIDRVGKTKEERDSYLKRLQQLVEGPYDIRNFEFANELKAKASRLKNLKINEVNSRYYEAALEDLELYSRGVNLTQYIDKLLQETMSMQQGLIKIDNFFDRPIDYKKMAEAFDADTFFLMFAKIIYEYNLRYEKVSGLLNNSCHYLYLYTKISGEYSQEVGNYNPKIDYIHLNGKKERISRYAMQNAFDDLLKRHPEAKPIVLPEMPDNIDKYKNIGLMEKIAKATDSGTAAWEFLPKGEKIQKGNISDSKQQISIKLKKDKSMLIEEVNERIEILENSGYLLSPIVGLDTFSGYYAFVYPNGKVILEKFWENGDVKIPADGCATYVMSIDNFVDLSKMPKLALIEYIKSFPEIGVKRIFHTTNANWQRNLYKEINGTYRFEDAIDFINNLKSGVTRHE